MGPLIPLFWTSGDICSRFQSQGVTLDLSDNLTEITLWLCIVISFNL